MKRGQLINKRAPWPVRRLGCWRAVRLGFGIALAWCCAGGPDVFGAADAAPKPGSAPANIQSAIRGGFTIPVSDGSGGVRTLFSGKEMRPLAGGRMLITEFRMTNREPALIVEAPQCLFDPSSFEASSTGALRVATADGRFALTGVGFAWDHAAGRMTVSNEVQTRIEGDLRAGAAAIKSPPPAGSSSSGMHQEIRANRFSYHATNGTARYEGSVQVAGPRWRLACGSLTGAFLAGGASLSNAVAEGGVRAEFAGPGRQGHVTGARGVYTTSVDGERLAIEGGAQWEADPYRGGSDRLVLLSQGEHWDVQAEGNASLSLPRPAGGRPPQTNRVAAGAIAPGAAPAIVEVTCDAYELRSGLAVFTGHVRAREPGFAMECARMTATIEPEGAKLKELTADGGVRLKLQETGREVEAVGERARYWTAAGRDQVEVTGNPSWKSAAFDGQSGRLWIAADAAGYEVRGDGGAQVGFPRELMGAVELIGAHTDPGRSAAPARALPDRVQIRSNSYTLRSGSVEFEGGVQVGELPGRLTSDRFVAVFGSGTNRLEKLTAEGRVVFEQAAARLVCGVLRGEQRAPGQQLNYFEALKEVELVLGGTAGATTTARGEQAEFDGLAGRVYLRRSPWVRTAQGVVMTGAREMTWDVAAGRFNASGPFAIEGPIEVIRAPEDGGLQPRPADGKAVAK